MTRRPEVIPLELGTFRFPEPELSHRQGVVMGYAVRHRGGVFLFDTGLGFGNEELDERYHPVARRIRDALAEAGIEIADVTAVANCHLHADHAGQNAAFPDVPIYVQAAEWDIAHTTEHTILDWIDFPARRVRPAHRRPRAVRRAEDRHHARPHARPPVARRRRRTGA